MASLNGMSLSESVHASIILQRQESRKRNQQQQQQKKDHVITTSQSDAQGEGKPPPPPVTIPFCVQLLLTVVFAGTELANTFSFIYNLLFLQFLGVPTELMTLGGVAAGCASIICLPITGWLADRGSNLVKRKMIMMMFSLVAYILGFSGLTFCSLMKLGIIPPGNTTQTTNMTSMDQILIQLDNMNPASNSTTTPYNVSALINTEINPHQLKDMLFETTPYSTIDDQPSHKYIPMLGIISFALVDLGYDTANTLCRSFVLEICPVEIHTRILIVITGLGSMAGLVFSTIGTVDFPDILCPMFNVDGTAATMLLFSSSLLIIVILSFICTMITGYFVHKYFEEEKIKQTRKQLRMSPHGMRRAKGKLGTRRLWKLHHVMNSNLNKDKKDSSARLLGDDGIDNKSYSAMSDFSVSDDEDVQNVDRKIREADDNQSRILQDESQVADKVSIHSYMNSGAQNQKIESYTISTRKQPSRSEKVSISEQNENCSYQDSVFSNVEKSQPENENQTSLQNENVKTDTEKGIETKNEDALPELSEIASAVAAAIKKQSISMSLSLFQATLLSDNKITTVASGSDKSLPIIAGDSVKLRKKSSIWKNKRLYVILLSMFFSVGSVLAFMIYSGNTLTLGVYHGVPTALPGTVDRDNYEKGLRRSALGNVIVYLAYALAGLINGKIIDIFGENAYFIACHMTFIGVSVGFQFTKMEQLYFTTAAVSGFFRTCSFTLVYIMVHKLVKEECSGSGDPSKPIENIGQVMAAIGFLLPCHYLILSIMTGPLISVTGDVWVAGIIQIVDCSLALVVFMLVFVIKR